VAPDYRGGSLVNLPATVGRLLGVSGGWAAPPLAAARGPDGIVASHVLLLVIDGLGLRALERRPDLGGRLEALVDGFGGRSTTLTSVLPSTTSVATTALLGNGAAPAESGMLGYTQRLRRFGLVGNMLFWTVPGEEGGLERPGLRPETFLQTPSLFEVLEVGGVPSAAFLPASIARSPLSRLQFRGATPRGLLDLATALGAAERFLRSTPRGFAYVYTPDLDTVSHREGPETEGWERVLDGMVTTLESWLEGMRPWPGCAPRLLITADHGLVGTPPEQRRLLSELDGVGPLLACGPGGEARHLYLYARHGAKRELLAALEQALGPEFLVIDGRAALGAGLYGDPERLHPEALDRVGDAVVLAHGAASLWPDDPGTVLLGMHGSLEADEMLVPLFDLPLDRACAVRATGAR
jgi:hypothetical protein